MDMCCVCHKLIVPIILKNILFQWEARWPHGLCARLRVERSRVGALPGDILLCCRSRHFHSEIGTGKFNAGGNPAMD